MFIRYKKVKDPYGDYYYAYLIKSYWVKAKKQSRQKVIKYLGKYHKSNKGSKIELDLCKNCGSKANLTIDHIVPLCKKGSLEIENLQCLCIKCNQKKGKR